MIWFTMITLFPEALEAYLSTSMMRKASEKGLARFELVNLRDYGLGPHRSVDDTPYGGGDGMLLRCEPVFAAVEAVLEKDPDAKVILPTPAGEIWSQRKAQELAGGHFVDTFPDSCRLWRVALAKRDEVGTAPRSGDSLAGATPVGESVEKCPTPDLHYVILCPHYEGYDERILSLVDYKVSLGKFVLTGGEIPALAIVDSIVRLIPGVLGGENSAEIESFSHGDNLEYPQYTRPEEFRGMRVPEVLLSGNHGEIAKWRDEHSKQATEVDEPCDRGATEAAEAETTAGQQVAPEEA